MHLTAEQLATVLTGEPLRFTAPETNSEFVLVSADLYERLKSLVIPGDCDPGDGYEAFRRAAGEEWDDPALDVYEQYRKKP